MRNGLGEAHPPTRTPYALRITYYVLRITYYALGTALHIPRGDLLMKFRIWLAGLFLLIGLSGCGDTPATGTPATSTTPPLPGLPAANTPAAATTPAATNT